MPNIPSSFVIPLQKSTLDKGKNSYLLAQIGFIENEVILAKEYWHHESCRKEISQDVQKYNQAYVQLVTFAEKVVMKKENGFLFEKTQGKYKSMEEERGCSFLRYLIPKKNEVLSLNWL